MPFYSAAFAGRPTLAENLGQGLRYEATRAGAGGRDSDTASPATAGLRRQALEWLRADLKLSARLPDGGPASRAAVRAKVSAWLREADLAGVRQAEALAKLPPDEARRGGSSGPTSRGCWHAPRINRWGSLSEGPAPPARRQPRLSAAGARRGSACRRWPPWRDWPSALKRAWWTLPGTPPKRNSGRCVATSQKRTPWSSVKKPTLSMDGPSSRRRPGRRA